MLSRASRAQARDPIKGAPSLGLGMARERRDRKAKKDPWMVLFLFDLLLERSSPTQKPTERT